MRWCYETVAVATILILSPVHAAVIHVDVNADPGGDGMTWCTAYNDLAQVTHYTAQAGDEVRVAQGTYVPGYCLPFPCTPTSAVRQNAYVLRSGIVVRGGYAGCGTPDPDERDFVAHPSILSGDLNQDDGPLGSGTATDGERAENCYHVVTSNVTDADSILDGFTIYGGNADGGATFDSGGGCATLTWGTPTRTTGSPRSATARSTRITRRVVGAC